MCGILGAVSHRLDHDQFSRALSSLEHRGPDHKSIFSGDGVWLGHTRLAINDLSREANQPFFDTQSGCTVVFNGEIYNYRSLRKELGHTGAFYTDCEAEVLARLYSMLGEAMPEKLDGMFAFVIFDPMNNRLFGARDRLGKKPFFFHLADGQGEFYFASELKAFRHFPVPRSLDTRILDNILNFTHFCGESILQGIHALPAGGAFTIDLTPFKFQQRSYFELSELINAEEHSHWRKIGIEAATHELFARLNHSVEKRLISDVPVAIIASGGLDSSLVSSLANHHGRYDLLHIDSVDSSELCDAKAMSQALNVTLKTDRLDYARFCELLGETISHWEYPLVHTNATGILLVARLARQEGYKVVLGGEGADELFGGYPHHKQYRLAQMISSALSWVPTSLAQSLVYARSDNKGGNAEPTIQHIMNRHDFSVYYDRYEFIQHDFDRKMHAFMATDMNDYLVPLLSRADRMTMASGVEMRLPFLDMEVIKMALNLPMSYKISYFQQKRILRSLARDKLPHINRNKSKVGFTVNYAKRFLEDVQPDRLPHLENYIPTEIIMKSLKQRGQYHKMFRLYSLDQVCGQLL